MSAETSPSPDELLGYDEPAGQWVLAATVLGSSVAFLDATVVNIALPAIGSDLGGGIAGLTWTVNAYTLTLAALVLVGGALGDRFGRRRVFMVGAAWFGVASLACAVATDMTMLVAFRALQGVGAALLTPGALAILQAAFRAEDRSRAIGAWSGLAGITGALGPFLGGWLVEVASWRWIFFLNVPVVVAVLVISARHVPESRDPTASGRVDLPGAGLAVVGLGALSIGLTSWSEEGLGALEVQAGIGVGLLALAAFLAYERVAPHPMLPPGIFASARFRATNAVTFLVYAALGGVFFWFVVTLQVVAGWEPLMAGISLLPVTVLMLLFSPSAGRFGDRYGARLPMTLGPLVAAVGVALMSRVGPDAGYQDVLAPVTLLGVGLTLTVTPLTTTVLSAVTGDHSGVASGVNNAVARTGGLLLIAVLPALTGLGQGGFGNAPALEAAFGPAMLICAGLLAGAGVLAAWSLRSQEPAAVAERPTGHRRHCGVDAPPTAVEGPA